METQQIIKFLHDFEIERAIMFLIFFILLIISVYIFIKVVAKTFSMIIYTIAILGAVFAVMVATNMTSFEIPQSIDFWQLIRMN